MGLFTKYVKCARDDDVRLWGFLEDKYLTY